MINYIDLFCGIGGFHQAIEKICQERDIECKCRFACDFDEYASKVYENNYKMKAHYDLTKEETHKVLEEKLDGVDLTFLFAGFPCQPFSKAGNREGFSNKTKGTLFFEIQKIATKYKPKYILLENVRNLEKHDNGETWNTIRNTLCECGYIVDHAILSPNEIGTTPALRDRIFITCYRKDLSYKDDFKLISQENHEKKETSIYRYGNIENGLKKQYFDTGSAPDIEENKVKTIDMWNELVKELKKREIHIISPMWPKYFDEKIDISDFPDWKKNIIYRNRKFYSENKELYDKWYIKNKEHFDSLIESDKKFEWNAGDKINDIWEGIIQFRPSGVRVKKPDFIPTLVAINQTPILGAERRYLKPTEMARLYGFKNLDFGNQNKKETYKQLGNTVSVDVVEYVIKHMLDGTDYRG